MYPRWKSVQPVLVALFLLSESASGFYSVTLSNSEMTDYVSGVAADWISSTMGSQAPPDLLFFADSGNYRTAPYAQGIGGIDTLTSSGVQFGAGMYRQIPVTPGDVYLFVGFQDLYDPYFTPPTARRYAHFFGIDTGGAASAPEPFAMGDVRWMGPDQWFYNEMPGNSTQVGGMHRCLAAWAATGPVITIWSGVFAYGDAPAAENPTVFDIDSHLLYGFDNSARSLLQNTGFETVENLTPSYSSDDVHRTTLPAYWVPIGGGIGQKESYYTESVSKLSGLAGLRIYNQRGCLTRGVMQRVQVPPNSISATFSAFVKASTSSGAIARVGVDPTGGSDINSSEIVWVSYERTDTAWEQESVTAAPAGTVVTVFLSMHNAEGTTGLAHYADFDDTALTFVQDQTPPPAFTVSTQSPWPFTSYLSASLGPPPTDPESGIALIEYAIGTTAGGEEVRAFTPSADPSSVSAYGLSLTPGCIYYVTVRVTNGAGLAATVTGDAVLCQPDMSALTPREVTVTGTFKHEVRSGTTTVWKSVPFCTVQGADRLSADRVITGSAQDSPVAPDSIKPGDMVSVTGNYHTIDGQQTIGYVTEDGTAVDVTVEKVGEVAIPQRPYMLSVKDLGGGTLGSKIGVTGGLGPNNVGMLVTACGLVKGIATDERGVKLLYVDDGSGVPCGPHTGFKVCAPGTDAEIGDFVIVTGASSIEEYDPTPGSPGDESYIRAVVPRDIRRME